MVCLSYPLPEIEAIEKEAYYPDHLTSFFHDRMCKWTNQLLSVGCYDIH